MQGLLKRASLKAGGVGLNPTAADTVIHYDPWWHPAVEDQASDRAHRIGLTKPVFVHKLMTLGSIEEKMESLKANKRVRWRPDCSIPKPAATRPDGWRSRRIARPAS